MDNDERLEPQIKDIRKTLKGKVASPSKLSPTEVLLRAAAYRLIDQETFEAVRLRHARGKGRKDTRAAFSALEWPQTAEEVPIAPKRKRPDLAARLVDAKTKKFDVVVCSWRRVCKEDTWKVLTPALKAVMDRLNQVTIEAYELANYHVIRCLTEDVPLQPLNGNFFYRCCNAVCVDLQGRRVGVEDPDLDASAKRFHEWRVDRPAVCNRGLSRPFQVLSEDMATSCDNMFDATFFRRMRRWVLRTVDCSGKYATKIMALTVGNRKDEPTEDEFILRLRHRLPHGTTLEPSNNHLFMSLLKMFQANDHRPKSLLPHKKGFKPHMMTINSNVLRMLLIEAGVEGVPGEPEFLRQKTEWWTRMFRVKKHETKHRFFSHEIVTDGKSARLLMYRRIEASASNEKTKSKKADPRAYGVPSVDWTRVEIVRSIDPGKRAMATSAGVTFIEDRSETDTLPILQFSSKGFYHDARYVETRRKEDLWKSKNKDVLRVENDLTRTVRNYSNVRDAKERMLGLWRAMDVLVPYYSANRFKNTRLNRFVGAKKALGSIVSKITGERPDKTSTVIAMGDWGAKAMGIKGCPGGPIARLERGLRKVATVFKVDESYTSKTCWCCHQQAMQNMMTQDHRGRRVKVHGVLHCQSSDCKGKTWDRDHNAALNILEIAMCLVKGWERPSCFRNQEEVEDVSGGGHNPMSRRTRKKPSMRSRS